MTYSGSTELHIVDASELCEHAYALCLQALDEEEIDRYRRFVFERDRRTFVAAHALLRCALGGLAQVRPEHWRFGREDFGRPFLLGPSSNLCSFNLSHSGSVAAAAVCPVPFRIGVDIEEIKERDVSQTTANSFCSPTELSALAAFGDRPRYVSAYYRFWTLKESYLKAVGVGIGEHLRNVECRLHPPSVHPRPDISKCMSASCWQCEAIDRFSVAISIVGPSPVVISPVVRWWSSIHFIDALGENSLTELSFRKGRLCLHGAEEHSPSSGCAVSGAKQEDRLA